MPDIAVSTLATTTTRRLLVVDDEAVQRLMVTSLAEGSGLAVEQAATLEQAARQVVASPFDVVVLDLALHDRDGIELLRTIRKAGRDPALIFISGFDERVRQAAVRLAAALGLRVAGALAKPLPLESLRAMLTNLSAPPPPDAPAESARIDPAELARAIEKNEIVCLYQPKVTLADRRIVGVEVLSRWTSSALGPVRPDIFIRLAENHGLIDCLSNRILNQALAAFAPLRAEFPHLTLAVNVSPLSLVDLTLPEQVFAALDAASVPPSALVLEVTEGAVMADFAAAADILTRFRIHNVGISIDDFGTGYSSLLSLLRLPFNELKIDQHFIRLLPNDPEAGKIVRAIIRLARELEVQLVAEGIETEDTARLLRSFGCSTGQGELFDRPLTAAALAARLRGTSH